MSADPVGKRGRGRAMRAAKARTGVVRTCRNYDQRGRSGDSKPTKGKSREGG